MARFAAFLVTAVLAASGLTAQEKPAGGWWDDIFEDRPVALGKVVSAPDAFRELPVTFVVQFHEIGKTASAYYTKFDPESWLSFSVWPDEAPLWEKKAYESDFDHLYVKRGTHEAKLVGKASLYKRFVVSGVVVDVIRGKPWIEVVSVKELPEQMNEASLVHVVKGLMLRDLRKYDAASREFAAADAETLPLHVRLLAMREEALSLLNAGRATAAEARLLAALSLSREDTDTALALAHVRSSLGRGADKESNAAPPKENREQPESRPRPRRN